MTANFYPYPMPATASRDKGEVARSYFPQTASLRSAQQNLRRAIHRCTELHDALRAAGYLPKQHSFTPRQLALLYYYLGEP